MIQAARSPRIRGVAQDHHPFVPQQSGHPALQLWQRQHGHSLFVIRHCKQNALGSNHRYSYAINLRVQQVGPMARRVEPSLVYPARIGAYSDVFLDQAEVSARFARPRRHVWLAAVAMRDRPLRGHEHAVFHGGIGQRLVPQEPPSALLRPRFIRHREQLLGLGRLRHTLARLSVQTARARHGKAEQTHHCKPAHV